MLIFCAGMSRSAGTLQYQLVKDAVESKELGLGYGFHYRHSVYPPDEISVIKTETPENWMLTAANNYDTRVVSIVRDPRDVAVSLLHFFNARHEYDPLRHDHWTLDDIIAVWLERIMGWIKAWGTVSPLTLVYEDCYHGGWDIPFSSMCDYLDLPLTASERIAIISEYTISKNIERQNALSEWIDPKRSMLTKEHISPNRGSPGVWKDILTYEQRYIIEDTYRKWMILHDYL